MTDDEAQQVPAADAARLDELVAAMLRATPSLGDLESATGPVVEQKVAEAQAQANELAAQVLSARPGERGAYLAGALRSLNSAAGFDFDGFPPPPNPERLARSRWHWCALPAGCGKWTA
jgi:hypothetical protein